MIRTETQPEVVLDTTRAHMCARKQPDVVDPGHTHVHIRVVTVNNGIAEFDVSLQDLERWVAEMRKEFR